MYGMLTDNNDYVMLNHIFLASDADNTRNYYAVTGFYENRWAIQCLVELLKHLHVMQFRDFLVNLKYAHRNIMYSKLYKTTFEQ
jgi:hypothetical protein